ncbi:hypothetical protein [Streptomyces sp. NBC_00878]|uniref:hypothetical protein n=1 Tax=Streptomyces sp. NBC_00878 TaxID=2975854 RepID=UPI00225832ED|nr:hypothetical protein [Streptomyces sp. NBC_00878]MCX4909964.1 hypothetical protein [Streptomyces sp. NBC_00878]
MGGSSGAVLVGIAIAFGFATLPAILLSAVTRTQTGVANGINSVSRSVGSAVASALLGTLLAAGKAAGVPAENRFTLAFGLAGGAFAIVAGLAVFGLRSPGGPRPPLRDLPAERVGERRTATCTR